MKARLYKGPFSGKVVDCDGHNEIIITGPKRMTRKQRYDAEIEFYHSGKHGFVAYRPPLVKARYRVCAINTPTNPMLMPNTSNSPVTSLQVVPTVLMHPDGSIFYEFVDKKEYP
jgi:hypothetical protein